MSCRMHVGPFSGPGAFRVLDVQAIESTCAVVGFGCKSLPYQVPYALKPVVSFLVPMMTGTYLDLDPNSM